MQEKNCEERKVFCFLSPKAIKAFSSFTFEFKVTNNVSNRRGIKEMCSKQNGINCSKFDI